MYQDLSMCHDWPVKKAIVELPIRLKGNLKIVSNESEQGHWGCFTCRHYYHGLDEV